jgi:hypothetical protein
LPHYFHHVAFLFTDLSGIAHAQDLQMPRAPRATLQQNLEEYKRLEYYILFDEIYWGLIDVMFTHKKSEGRKSRNTFPLKNVIRAYAVLLAGFSKSASSEESFQ